MLSYPFAPAKILQPQYDKRMSHQNPQCLRRKSKMVFVVLSYPCCFFITLYREAFICDLIIRFNPLSPTFHRLQNFAYSPVVFEEKYFLSLPFY